MGFWGVHGTDHFGSEPSEPCQNMLGHVSDVLDIHGTHGYPFRVTQILVAWRSPYHRNCGASGTILDYQVGRAMALKWVIYTPQSLDMEARQMHKAFF